MAMAALRGVMPPSFSPCPICLARILSRCGLSLIQSDKDILVLQSSSLLCRHFTSNHFSRNLPATFANLTKLNHVQLGNNQFSGTIPNFI
ncbi:brassinosteroid LRR receptor kinase BRI1-like [Arachis ipaensis]|uniref:brassinosteroid LRR receptor kinase BRI1-like n=1 Tax=Arachis ipaensis TaxID=130454 RepID=UPI000A2B68C9|nr:brassinosteroid LRR receptor kinase BRI1-like [Arachis ipaensis]